MAHDDEIDGEFLREIGDFIDWMTEREVTVRLHAALG